MDILQFVHSISHLCVCVHLAEALVDLFNLGLDHLSDLRLTLPDEVT